MNTTAPDTLPSASAPEGGRQRPVRRLSGIQPTGNPHLGNYFGAMRQHIEHPEGARYFVADRHALTTVTDAEALRRDTREVALTYLALGLDVERATLFRQSDVPEVTELMWLLAAQANKGLLERAVSYKDKVANGLPASLGLFLYPVLMAADILAFDTERVPVGPDQIQHIEIARDLAQSFHRAFGEAFTLPEYELVTPTPVLGIDGRKMSKSYDNTIPVFAEGADLRERVMAIVTDSRGLGESKDPELCTVYQLYCLVAEPSDAELMADRYRAGGYGYGHAKLALIDAIDHRFDAARQRRRELLARPDDIEDLLKLGASRARAAARRVMERARRACGA